MKARDLLGIKSLKLTSQECGKKTMVAIEIPLATIQGRDADIGVFQAL